MDRTGQNRTVVPVLVDKDTSWQDEILDLCFDSIVTGTIPRPKVTKQFPLKATVVLTLVKGTQSLPKKY